MPSTQQPPLTVRWAGGFTILTREARGLLQLSRFELLNLVTMHTFEPFFLAVKPAFFSFSLMPLLAVIDLQKKQQLIRKHFRKRKCNNWTFAEFAVNAQGAYLRWRMTYHGAKIGLLAGDV